MNKYFNYLKNNLKIFFESHNQSLKIKEQNYISKILEKQPDSLLKFGFKVYSQGHEDGVLEEIFRRLNIEKPNFIEIGCGNGVENNTHYLLLKGSKGIWIDSDKKNIKFIRRELNNFLQSNKLMVLNKFVDSNNIPEIVSISKKFLGISNIDLVSVDVDGNDFYILKSLVENNILPKVIVTEYNSKFPHNLKFVPKLNTKSWKNDDYMGASLLSIQQLLSNHYCLVACTHTGVNAFFIRSDLKNKFEIIDNIKHFRTPNYYSIDEIISKRKTLLENYKINIFN